MKALDREDHMANTHTALNIGSLAKQAQVNIQTIRYYERRELLPEPDRTASNYRVYPCTTVQRVRFIKQAQELGFTLKEIKELLALRITQGSDCSDVRSVASAKIEDIETRIASLQSMKKSLSKLVRTCSGKGDISECPILEAMDTGRSK